MVDVSRPATLQGFPVSVADIGDQMHLCHPLLSFEGDHALYLAHELDWHNHPDALAVADADEASTLGTLLPPRCRLPIVAGEGVIAVGAAFVRAAQAAKVNLRSPEISFTPLDDSSTPEPTVCWMGVATPASHEALRNRMVDEAGTAFDEALADAALHGSPLSEAGNAALLLMRKAGSTHREDLAIRQLAGARQNGAPDLYRRLLVRFAIEFDTEETVLDERARRHIDFLRYSGFCRRICATESDEEM